jgi:hypothetical protein
MNLFQAQLLTQFDACHTLIDSLLPAVATGMKERGFYALLVDRPVWRDGREMMVTVKVDAAFLDEAQ